MFRVMTQARPGVYNPAMRQYVRKDAASQRKPEGAMDRCECEHVDHFHGGNAHPYQKKCLTVMPVKTLYGTYNVCEYCRTNCLAEHIDDHQK